MYQKKADYAALRIREALASGRFAAGERLAPRDLARELDLSLTPVREALIELAAEGLIEMRPHRGPHVASTSPESLEEIYMLRETLEGLAVQLAAQRATDDELAGIAAIHQDFAAAHAEHASDRLADLSDQFHLAIYSAAKTPMLLRLIKIVLAGAPSGILSSIPGRADRSLDDHARLLETLRQHDANAAREIMTRHLHETLAFVEQYRSADGLTGAAAESSSDRAARPSARATSKHPGRKRATSPPSVS